LRRILRRDDRTEMSQIHDAAERRSAWTAEGGRPYASKS